MLFRKCAARPCLDCGNKNIYMIKEQRKFSCTCSVCGKSGGHVSHPNKSILSYADREKYLQIALCMWNGANNPEIRKLIED